MSGQSDGRKASDSDVGDTQRTERWVRAYHADVYRYVLRLSGSPENAEDLTQQTFLLAHVHGGQLRDETKVLPWLLAIARTRFWKSLLKRHPQPATDVSVELDRLVQVAEVDGDEADWEVDGERLMEALACLPPDWRVIVTMYYYERATYKEIAAALGLPLGTVMSRLARAKLKLRRLYFSSVPLGAATTTCQALGSQKHE